MRFDTGCPHSERFHRKRVLFLVFSLDSAVRLDNEGSFPLQTALMMQQTAQAQQGQGQQGGAPGGGGPGGGPMGGGMPGGPQSAAAAVGVFLFFLFARAAFRLRALGWFAVFVVEEVFWPGSP